MLRLDGKIAFITGASSGIGAACARQLAAAGAKVLIAARRVERLAAVGEEIRVHGGAVHTLSLDVGDPKAVSNAVRSLPQEWASIDILVNNAGLARGLERISDGLFSDWEEMINTNVRGLLAVTRAVSPGMVARRRGHIVNIGSISGHEVYPGGVVYCATKHAVRALTRGMHMDLLGTDVRVTSIDPGMVETEFSEVRFHGDKARAAEVYRKFVPLSADDVADAVLYAVTRPAHVNVSELLLMPTHQASVVHSHAPVGGRAAVPQAGGQ